MLLIKLKAGTTLEEVEKFALPDAEVTCLHENLRTLSCPQRERSLLLGSSKCASKSRYILRVPQCNVYEASQKTQK